VDVYLSRFAHTIAVSESVEPTEISMPPLMITKVIPTAMMPTTADSRSSEMMLLPVRKSAFRLENIVSSTTNNAIVISRRNVF